FALEAQRVLRKRARELLDPPVSSPARGLLRASRRQRRSGEMIEFSPTDEQKALIDTARRFAKERIIPVAAKCDHDSRFPMEVFQEAWGLGLINAPCPAEYGGAGFGELDNALITEELAYGCSGIQTSMLANVLALTPIKLAGNEEQKQRY